MAWIESHQTLGHHPKTQQLATLLKVSLPTAVGHLHFLWWWTLDFAPTGVVTNPTPGLIAHAAQWKGKPDRFWLAMIQSGFLDVDEDRVSVHDWLDYAGRLVSRRAANAERQRRHRHAENGVTSRVTNAHVTGLPDRTQPDLTGPDPTNPPNPPSDPAEGGRTASLDRTPTLSTNGDETACCPQFAMSGKIHYEKCPNARKVASA